MARISINKYIYIYVLVAYRLVLPTLDFHEAKASENFMILSRSKVFDLSFKKKVFDLA